MQKIPNHVAIILDGNGRWAKQRGLKRSLGHKAGFENLKTLAKYVFDKGVKVLSVYAFSTENFKREKDEVDYLMNLLVNNFKHLIGRKDNVKIVFSGRRDNLRADVVKTIEEIENMTKDNTEHIFNICWNYGCRLDILNATKKIALDYKNGVLDINDLDEEKYREYLYNNMPDIDLLIRTSGELRISNYMLYQLSYSEMYFPEVLFPDFNDVEFEKALDSYSNRDRRFGSINKDS